MSETIDKLNIASQARVQTTREKLAQTYFNNSSQTVKVLPPLPNPPSIIKKPKKQLYIKKDLFPFVILAVVSVFMIFVLIRYTVRTDSAIADRQASKPLTPAMISTYKTGILLIQNFDLISTTNNLGGYFGTFSQTPEEKNQFCYASFDKDTKVGLSGHSLRLDYSLKSPASISNGFWMSLSNLNAANYTGLEFFIKGDKKEEYPASIKLQLVNANQRGSYIIDGITGDWKKVYIPFHNFSGLKDLDHLLKLLVIFESKESAVKKGTIYIDNLMFCKQ